jgi:glycosyltransferase involved in cell wall biosynthesis
MSLRIALLCHRYVPHLGGVEIVVKHLAAEFARQHQVSVITAGLAGEERFSVEDGAEVHRLAAVDFTERIGAAYPLPLGPGVRRAWQALQEADVLHAHGSLYAVSAAGAVIARRRGIPLVVTEHVGVIPYRSPILRAVQNVAWRSVGDFVAGTASALVACGDRVARWMRERYPASAVHLVPNGVDLDRFRPLDPAARAAARAGFGLPQGRTLALFVGRQSEKKNFSAVRDIPRQHFDLVLCGGAGRFQADGVFDVGTLDYARMPGLMGCVDLLVHAGIGEGFPLVVQESLACGVPVVLLWDPGYAPIIDRDVVRACGTIEQFSREVQEMAKDGERREALRRDCRPYAERTWSWPATAAAYLDLYEGALHGSDALTAQIEARRAAGEGS